MNLFEKVFRELNKGGVKYLVIGGVAINLYGYLRATGDIDLLLLLNKENLLKMNRVMRKLRYYERLPISITELNNKKKLMKWMKEKNLKAFTFVPPINNPLQIDIVISESLQFEKLYKKREMKAIGKLKIPLASLADIIRMKRKAKRDKDMLDLKVLKYFSEL